MAAPRQTKAAGRQRVASDLLKTCKVSRRHRSTRPRPHSAVAAPRPVDFRDRRAVRQLYEPRVCEVVKEQTGASRVLFMSHAFRTDGAFAQFAHTDYSPDFEPLLRRMLVGRHGLSEADATSCGMVAAGLWTPVGHPAYLDPLALLQRATSPCAAPRSSSIEPERSHLVFDSLPSLPSNLSELQL